VLRFFGPLPKNDRSAGLEMPNISEKIYAALTSLVLSVLRQKEHRECSLRVREPSWRPTYYPAKKNRLSGGSHFKIHLR